MSAKRKNSTRNDIIIAAHERKELKEEAQRLMKLTVLKRRPTSGKMRLNVDFDDMRFTEVEE